MPKVLLEVPATVSLQGTIVRSRVPTSALNTLGAEDEDAIQWQVQEAGDGLKYIVGTVEKGGAKNIQRTPPTPPKRAPKAQTAAKKGAAKKGPAAVLDEFADAPGTSEDELWADPPKAPAKKAVAAPVKKSTGYGVPAAKAPIPKPSAAKAPAKKAVAYEIPGGGLDEFAD